jgi:hypothetical protein
MPLVLANVVDPKVKRVEHSFVNLHSMPGGHSRDQLTKSLRLRIMEMEKTSKGLVVKVKLSNSGAGHMVPTGSPSRKVILNLDVTPAEGEAQHDERIYQRIIGDDAGNPILSDAELFLHSSQVLSDSRLAPGEERVEEFLLPVPDNQNLKVEATLTYVYSPHNRPETEDRLDFFTETRRLVSNWSR